MEIKTIENKNGDVMRNKQGQELKELRLEEGDEFVPIFNRVLEKSKEVEIKGKKKNITNYVLKCRARDKNGELVRHNDSEEIFITLTPTQAKSLNKLADDGLELNQNLFRAYKYESKEYGKQIGVGLKKDFKQPKTFEDFDKKVKG